MAMQWDDEDVAEAILTNAKQHKNGRRDADIRADLADLEKATEVIVTSRGAASIIALFRGGLHIGYAVWSCRAQNWVAGNWCEPLAWHDAVAAERSIPWQG